MEPKGRTIVTIFRGVDDENRIAVLRLLTAGEKSVPELLDTMRITQPTLSHHMKILQDSGLVSCRKEGKRVFYSISQEGVAQAIDFLAMLTVKP